MLVFLPCFIFFACEKTEKSKPKEQHPKYYYYEYEEGTVRCHIEKDGIVTCLDVID